MSRSYLVNEIYSCLQGEGPNSGKPSVLVRFQICNLRCTWCDTPYTHTFKSDPINIEDVANGPQRFSRLSLEAVLERILEHKNISHIIFSGGEPTLQNFMPIFLGLPRAYSGEVETNGTRIPHKHMPGFRESDYNHLQWNVSPKGRVAKEIIVPEALEHWVNLSKKDVKVFFKFVCRTGVDTFHNDKAEILELVNAFKIPRHTVVVMPEGVTPESQLHRVEVHDYCLRQGFRLSLRQHILLFGQSRGV